jgi:excisionase family DNA binding protein
MTKPKSRRGSPHRLSYSIRRLAQQTDVGRSTIYEEISSGRLTARKVGRRTIVRRSDAIRWLRSLAILGREDSLEAHPNAVNQKPAGHELERQGD